MEPSKKISDITYLSELTRHRTLAGSIRPANGGAH
jgi:hypothetical protein